MKKAVMVAAGLSSRLYPLTETKPKCLLEIGGTTIVERNVALLNKYGFEEIVIVTGYLNEKIEGTVGGSCKFIYNPYYKYCNNMGSLFCARDEVGNEPFLYMHGDIVFTEQLLQQFLQESKAEEASLTLAVDFKETDEEAMKVKVTEQQHLISSNKEIPADESAGEWTGLAIIKDPESVFEEIEAILKQELLTVYDTHAFTAMASKGYQIKCLSTKNQPWIEIDFIEDYNLAKRMFG